MNSPEAERYVVVADPVMGSRYDVSSYNSLDLAVNEAKRLNKTGFYHIVEQRKIVWQSDE